MNQLDEHRLSSSTPAQLPLHSGSTQYHRAILNPEHTNLTHPAWSQECALRAQQSTSAALFLHLHHLQLPSAKRVETNDVSTRLWPHRTASRTDAHSTLTLYSPNNLFNSAPANEIASSAWGKSRSSVRKPWRMPS
jgi:hypothetical protein